MCDAWRWGGSAPRRCGSSGNGNGGGELVGVENQGRSLAVRRGEGGERQRWDGVGPGKAGEVGCKPNRRRGRPVGGGFSGGGGSRAPADQEEEERWEGPIWNL